MSDISLTFPDGAKRAVPSGTTGLAIAKSISPSLAKRTASSPISLPPSSPTPPSNS